MIICRKSCPISIVTEYAVVVLTTNDPNFSVVHDYSKDFQWFRCFQSKMNEFDMNKFKNYCKMVHKNDQIILLRKAVAKHQPIIVQPTVPPVYSHLYCHKIFLHISMHISNNNVIFCFLVNILSTKIHNLTFSCYRGVMPYKGLKGRRSLMG